MFIAEPDAGVAEQCDSYAQDCAPGDKCMPWASGGGSWDALGCFRVDAMPAQIGDSCSAEQGGTSGIDTCDVGLMCWDVDPVTELGTCIALCQGSPEAPTCPEAGVSCTVANGGVLNLCLPSCDPVAQDCEIGDACYPADGSFSCIADAGGDEGAYGDPCEYINVCDPGLFCSPGDGVPNCLSFGCCTPFCNIEDPAASMNCPGADEGQECVPWFEDGQAPPGLEHVGACTIPV